MPDPAGMTAATLPDPATRTLITLSSLIAVLMVTIDGTIAIIALPRIQSNLVASPEQIAWVLTAYLIAQAIATPLSGWLADRFGRIRIMMFSVAGFTVASIGCGLAPNLEVLVLFRFLQGACGASLVPLAQVLLIDIYPPEKQGPAIAMFGIGTLLGPMLGPVLGGWLTEYVSWRSIFLVNAPIGVAAFLGLKFYARETQGQHEHPFDARGFAFVAVALAAFQLMLDRGQLLDWFSSTEICIEAVVAAMFFHFAMVHMFTVSRPFIKPEIFRDRNFLIGSILSAVVGIFLNGVIPIVTSLMQQLLGYTVLLTGLLSVPRAIGNILTIMAIGRIVSVQNARILIFLGMVMLAASFVLLATMSLDASQFRMGMINFLQGCGSGLLFLPLTMVVFSTLPQHQRNEASTLFALIRSLAGAAGISVIQAMTLRDMAGVQSHLVEGVRPDHPVVAWGWPDFDPANLDALRMATAEVARQAAMVAYVDTFQLILALAVVTAPLGLLMKRGRHAPAAGVALHAE